MGLQYVLIDCHPDVSERSERAEGPMHPALLWRVTRQNDCTTFTNPHFAIFWLQDAPLTGKSRSRESPEKQMNCSPTSRSGLSIGNALLELQTLVALQISCRSGF